MLIDSERVLLDLEQYLTSRPSHGRNDLLLKLAELRSEHTLDEGKLSRALRVLGVESLIHQDAPSADEDPDRVLAMAGSSDHSSPGSGQEGSTNGRRTAHT